MPSALQDIFPSFIPNTVIVFQPSCTQRTLNRLHIFDHRHGDFLPLLKSTDADMLSGTVSDEWGVMAVEVERLSHYGTGFL